MDNINSHSKLTEEQKLFFQKLSLYIEEPIYFYGSINRNDYLPNKSDIDIDIFTDNEYTTIYKICNYLHLDKHEFKKTVYKIHSKMVYGYKGKYVNEMNQTTIEISIYNNKYKNAVLQDRETTNVLPFYISIILVIIKYLYYHLGLLSNQTYKKCKQYLMNKGGELKFILIDN